MMVCAHCQKQIADKEAYCKAGANDTIFCSKKCVYQALKKFYTKNELDKMLKIIIPSR